jgi:DNA primase
MEIVEQIKSRVDIVDVVGQFVRLRKLGVRYVGLCPFHTEKTGSFSVHSVHQFFKCFGCGKGGDVIGFVMEHERFSFYEAVKWLAEQYNIPLPKRSDYSDPETKLRAALYRMHEIALEVFRSRLAGSNGAQARAYLEKRGVAAHLVEEFGLGYSERSGQDLTRRLVSEFTPEQLEASGLVLKRQEGGGFFDRFRNRLMFPIHNESGKIIAFAGRALDPDDNPKYLNSAETPIYRKSLVLYNLHRAKEGIRKQGRTVLVEGYMDVIGVSSAGVNEVVASCGTALTAQQIRMLKRHSERIVVNFDPDTAGENAAERSVQLLLDEDMKVRILQLDGGLDPDEYVKQHGAEAYQQKLDQASGYFHWLGDRARAKFDMRSGEGRVAGFQYLLPSLRRISDRLERMAIANDLASYLGVDQGLVLQEFRRSALRRSDAPLKAAPQEAPVKLSEKRLLRALLENQEIRSEILPQLRARETLEQLSAQHIFEVLITMAEKQGSFGYADLDARLEDRDKALLAKLALADDMEEEAVTVEVARSCLDQIQQAAREAHRTALKARVKEAERSGNLEEALRLAREITQLERTN